MGRPLAVRTVSWTLLEAREQTSPTGPGVSGGLRKSHDGTAINTRARDPLGHDATLSGGGGSGKQLENDVGQAEETTGTSGHGDGASGKMMADTGGPENATTRADSDISGGPRSSWLIHAAGVERANIATREPKLHRP